MRKCPSSSPASGTAWCVLPPHLFPAGKQTLGAIVAGMSILPNVCEVAAFSGISLALCCLHSDINQALRGNLMAAFPDCQGIYIGATMIAASLRIFALV